ncbi:hypothetical protein, partial [Streptomyces sp. YIM 98790]|uniref:hypothetical protein n=1 Tax=Streptomyces sp. YIM 98790 TaxID=2689077 RepID=UPI001A9D57B1
MSTSSTDHPACRSTSAETSPTTRANTGDTPNNPRPIPGHCHPCPGKTNTTEPSPTTPRTTND